jgi:hypothetical protein
MIVFGGDAGHHLLDDTKVVDGVLHEGAHLFMLHNLISVLSLTL